MTVLENVGLCDNGYIELQEIQPAQKIKLREPSYKAISAQYAAFVPSEKSVEDEEPTHNVNPVQTSIEIDKVVAINPRVAEMLYLLEIEGMIKSQAYKALKVNDSMCDNMRKNSTNGIDIAAAQVATTIEPVTDLEEKQPENNVPEVTEETQQVPETANEFKASRNGAVIAKVEKYAAEVVPTESVIEDTVTVSPTVIESESARPVSRDVPLVAPERIAIEEKKEQLISPKVEEENPASILNVSFLDNINSLADLREYLAKTARLKQEAEQAKTKEEEAKKSAERAEQEAANSRTEFVRTAEMIAAHQENLIAQTEQSNAQAHMYEEKRDEFEAERDEYEKAINDMLAVMGDSKADSKGRVM